MGRCLIFSGRTPARDRLVGHPATAFGDVACVGTVGELVDGLDDTPDVVLVGADDDSVWMEAVRQGRRHAPTMPVLVVAESPAPAPAVALVGGGAERAASALRLGARGFLRAGVLPDPRRL